MRSLQSHQHWVPHFDHLLVARKAGQSHQKVVRSSVEQGSHRCCAKGVRLDLRDKHLNLYFFHWGFQTESKRKHLTSVESQSRGFIGLILLVLLEHLNQKGLKISWKLFRQLQLLGFVLTLLIRRNFQHRC